MTDSERPNEQWWQQHGGQSWQEELESRRKDQPHYDKQEAFLRQYVGGLRRPRVLDFGCGYGRHIAYLRTLSDVEIYGVDQSPSMVQSIATYTGDAEFATQRALLIEPRGRLPFPDKFFDLVFTSEVLIHIAETDLPGVIQEILRVARHRILHIENTNTTESKLSNSQHGGCWVHDLVATYRELGITRVRVLPIQLQVQDVYEVTIDREWETLSGRLSVTETARTRLERDLTAAKTAHAELRSSTDRLEVQNHQLAFEVTTLERRTFAIDNKLTSLNESIGALRASWLAEKERGDALQGLLDQIEGSSGWRVLGYVNKLPGAHQLKSRARSALMLARRVMHPEQALTSQYGSSAATGQELTSRSAPTEKRRAVQRAEVLGVCHPNWFGIRAATENVISSTMLVPELQSDDSVAAAAGDILEAEPRLVVFSGFPAGYAALAKRLHSEKPGLRLRVLWHGALTQLYDTYVRARVAEIAALSKVGTLDGVGFVKSGMAEVFTRMGVSSSFVMNSVDVDLPPRIQASGPTPALGMFSVGATPNKNHYTQIAAASMIDNASLHVSATDPHLSAFADMLGVPMHVYGLSEHEKFLALLRTMDACLLVSLSEACPMTVLECLALGVPCVTSRTSHLLIDDAFLAERLLVGGHDNPQDIADKINVALAEREAIGERGVEYLKRYNEAARQTQMTFLDT